MKCDRKLQSHKSRCVFESFMNVDMFSNNNGLFLGEYKSPSPPSKEFLDLLIFSILNATMIPSRTSESVRKTENFNGNQNEEKLMTRPKFQPDNYNRD